MHELGLRSHWNYLVAEAIRNTLASGKPPSEGLLMNPGTTNHRFVKRISCSAFLQQPLDCLSLQHVGIIKVRELIHKRGTTVAVNTQVSPARDSHGIAKYKCVQAQSVD